MQNELYNDLKLSFFTNFEKQILPIIEPVEEARLKYISTSKKYLKIFLIAFIATIIVSVITFLLCKNFNLVSKPFILLIFFIYFLLLFACLFILKINELMLNYKIKQNIMPQILNGIPYFSFDINNPYISKEEILVADLLPNIENALLITDDNFSGEYKNADIKISECFFQILGEKRPRTVFSGPIIRIDMNKTFEGMTIIRPKGIKSLKNNLEVVKLEGIEMERNYDIYSSDQIEARYILTTSFMERFLNIKTKFKAERIYCSIYDKHIYIGLYCSKNLFEISSLSKSLTDKSQYEDLIDEFTSILALIDHFNLDKKLGL